MQRKKAEPGLEEKGKPLQLESNPFSVGSWNAPYSMASWHERSQQSGMDTEKTICFESVRTP